jgi:hypothetical protein
VADALHSEEWKRIAEQIAKETDGKKLTQLVKELCAAFDRANGTNSTAQEIA